MFRGSPLVVVYKMELSGSAKTKRTSSRPSATSGRLLFYQQIYIFSTPIAVSIMSGPSTASIRRIVLTGSIAAITATGTWYGAGLKTQQERNQVRHCGLLALYKHLAYVKQDKQATLESAASDQLAQMEALRGQLAHRRDELQAKIDQLTTKTVPANLPPRGR
jgi:hypothetical protein